MAKKNIELLKRLRTRFLRMRHPEHFNMAVVAEKTDCGTAMCIAGHTLNLMGYTRIYRRDTANYDWEWRSPQGKVVDPITEATRLLGLSHAEAEGGRRGVKGLFYRWNLKTPKQAAEAIDQIIQSQNGSLIKPR